MTAYQPPRRPPSQRNHLEQLISRYGQAHGIAPNRVRRWLTMMVMIGALDRAREDDAGAEFLVKGGVAIELRLGLRARATKDLDMTFRGDRDQLIAALDAALAEPYNNFSFERGEVEDIAATRSCRLEVKVAFNGRSWATAQLEISPPDTRASAEVDIVDAISISDFGLNGPDIVRVLALRYQIAQKLHACTETFDDGDNERFRDLIDLILLRSLITDLRSVRDACRDVFRARAKHSWPPRLNVPASWIEPYARLAGEDAFHITDVHAAAEEVRVLIGSIDAGMPITRPHVGQTWRRPDGVRVHIQELRPETAVVNETEPYTQVSAVNAIDPAAFLGMVLVDDPNQPSWLVSVEAGARRAVRDALESIGTVEQASSEIVSGALSSTVTARIVAADEVTVRQLVQAVLPVGADLVAVVEA